ncbi:uncharacterized protein LOC134178676 [Corticium candelabrum]|uniref:uncharacterized protein LOC134178676 n=1 Tax=Corticium candelabrum TaxID=121492 RepID=UPI002E257DD6|nr:uncharacterized protein LOC134178676 [Corticium candelabrum]
MSDSAVVRKVLTVAFGGAAVAAGAYFIYKSWKSTEHSSKDPDRDEEDVESESDDHEDVVPSEHRIVILGLDGAGKSSLMAALAGQKLSSSIPVTEGFNVINMNMEEATWNLWEVGGGQAYRQHWPRFLGNTSLLVYVVDSIDSKRFDESANTLWSLLGDEQLTNVPLLIVFNKQDIDGAKRPEELTEQFRLAEILKTRTVQLASSQVPPADDETGVSEFQGIVQIKQLIISLCESE